MFYHLGYPNMNPDSRGGLLRAKKTRRKKVQERGEKGGREGAKKGDSGGGIIRASSQGREGGRTRGREGARQQTM